MKSNRKLLIFIFRIIPKGFVSRVFGYLARMPLPEAFLKRIINWYSVKYGVNRDDILYPEGGFKTLDQFFTRSLKRGVHRVDDSPDSVVAPVDGMIDRFGEIDDNTIMQAKGIDYSLKDLIPSGMHREFIDGFFITMYLSPADYHRIHAPVSGKIAGYFFIPGKLFTVQEFMVNGLKGLFTKNERVISYILTDMGMVAVCKIGAMNVGRITLSYEIGIITNKFLRREKEYFYSDDERPNKDKGDEIGIFHLGSTVILLFQKGMISFDGIVMGGKIRLGERIAQFKKK